MADIEPAAVEVRLQRRQLGPPVVEEDLLTVSRALSVSYFPKIFEYSSADQRHEDESGSVAPSTRVATL